MADLDKFRIINSVIDAAAFYAGNYGLHKVSDFGHTPQMRHVIIFLIADLLVRNGYLTYAQVRDLVPDRPSVNLRFDAYISGLYVLIGAAYDLVVEKEGFGMALKRNLVYGAVGLGTNLVIDYVLPENYK
jgi:hypothetical protein